MASLPGASFPLRLVTSVILATLLVPQPGWSQDPPAPETDGLGALNATLRAIRFYPQDAVTPLGDERSYRTQFEVARLQYVGTELTFDLEAPTEAVAFTLVCTYAKPTGEEFGRFDLDFAVEAGWVAARHASALGYFEPGRWGVGPYAVSCTSGGRQVAQGQFEVIDGPPDLPGLGAKMVRLRFFESGNEVPALNQRAYAITFVGAETRYLNPEITLSFPDAQTDFEFPASCLFIRQNGTIYGAVELTIRGAAGSTRSISQRGFGSANPGTWPVGRYRAACLANGRFLGDAVFTVT